MAAMTTRIVLFDPNFTGSLQIELIREDFGYIHLPGLFRLWFAEAEIGEALSADTENSFAPGSLQVSLKEAQARLGSLARIAQLHPLAGHRPELPLWLEGIDHLIAKWRAHFDPKTRDMLRLALQDESADATECRYDAKEIENFRELYTDNWHDLVEAAAQGKFSLVDECLLFTTRSLNFGDWRAWTQVFGLEYLPDPYFRRLDGNYLLYTPTDTPIEVVPYEEFMTGDEDIPEEAPLDGMAICPLKPEDILPFEAVTAVVVCPGQPDQPIEAALVDLFTKDGEPQTARQLAMLQEKGDGFAGDPQKARHWRKQARDAAVRKLCEQAVDSIEQEDLELYRNALLDYICELYNDDGSKQARRAARAEVDFMNQQTAYWGCSTTLDLVHGIVLIDAAAGKPDFERGLLSLEIAANAHCAEAAYQLGRCYLFGHGVKRDPFKAHEFLTAAEKGGDRRALSDLIATLVLLSSRRDIPDEKRATFEQELNYFKEKRDDEASTMTPFVPEVRATPQFSNLRPRILAALWKFMN